MAEIFRTVFQVEVFSQGPYKLSEEWGENDLSDLQGRTAEAHTLASAGAFPAAALK
jgi:hypothetical protein